MMAICLQVISVVIERFAAQAALADLLPQARIRRGIGLEAALDEGSGHQVGVLACSEAVLAEKQR